MDHRWTCKERFCNLMSVNESAPNRRLATFKFRQPGRSIRNKSLGEGPIEQPNSPFSRSSEGSFLSVFELT
jgi:hypothetical protein